VLHDVTPESVDSSAVLAALAADRAPVRQRGARVCETLAADDVDAVRPFVDALGRALHDDDPGVVQTAAAALTEVTTTDPDAVTGVLDDAATLADATLGGVQVAGAQLLAAVARQRPSHCTPIVGTLLDRLASLPATDDGQSVAACVDDRVTQRTIQQHEQVERQHEQVARQVFANVVVAAAEADPSAVSGHVETVAELTTVEDPVVRGAALDVLAAVGQESPCAVDPVADVVVACLDADEHVVRARAVQTLGHLQDERHVDVLREVAETDSDEDVAALADETAAFLDA
jgi:HEAT repeat protein